MAEMLIDGAKLDACLDAEADAIRAKTGGSTDIAFDYANNKGFADAIAAIETGGGVTTQPLSVTENGTYTAPSGTAYTPVTVNVPTGGSLPSVIGKIDGGSFTFTSNTLTANYNVPHNLGVAPTGVAVWSDDVTADTSVRVEAAYMVFSGRYIVVQLNVNGTNRDVIANVPSGDLSASSFKTTVSANYYKAGATYKWLAWV